MVKHSIKLRLGLAAGAIALVVHQFAASSPFTDFICGMCTGLSVVFIFTSLVRKPKAAA